MKIDGAPPPDQQARLSNVLARLLDVRAASVPAALTEVADLLTEAFRADKIDVMFYESASHSLVAVGTSDTPMGRRQHELGLNRVPLANGGRSVEVFETGTPFRTGRVDQDPHELPGLFQGLGIRSEIIAPLDG